MHKMAVRKFGKRRRDPSRFYQPNLGQVAEVFEENGYSSYELKTLKYKREQYTWLNQNIGNKHWIRVDNRFWFTLPEHLTAFMLRWAE